MVTFNRAGEVLKEFQDWSWTIKGSLDTELKLESYPIDSILNSMVKTKNLGDGRYGIVGVLYAGNKILKNYKILTTQNRVVTELGNLIGAIIESYFGETDTEPFKSVYQENRIK